MLKDRVKQATRLVRSKQSRASTTENLLPHPLKEREEHIMTFTAIALLTVAIIIAIAYTIVLFKSEQTFELDADALAELSTDKEWWKVD